MADFGRRDFLGTAAAFAAAGGLFADDDRAHVRVRPLPRDPSVQLPLLGFGCGNRFPRKPGHGMETVDYELAERLVAEAMARGVNLFDTGYAYHGGESERFLGKTLARYPRASYLLSDKMPGWLCEKPGDAERIFAEQLARCRTDYFDFYLLHNIIDRERYTRVYVRDKVLDYLRNEKRRGRIRHLGLSFHGTSAFLDELLTENPDFEVCVLMLNAMEFRWKSDAAKLAGVCAKHGVGVFVMEPLAGGRAAHLRGEPRETLRRVHPDDTPAKWGLRFAASQPNVLCVLSGMSRFEHVRENVETLGAAFAPLAPAERAAYETAIAQYMRHPTVPCTGCRYCVPCPYGVKIPELFAWYNDWAQAGRLPSETGANDSRDLRRRFLASYNNTFAPRERADRCLACGKCQALCPQWNFRIADELGKIAERVSRIQACRI